MSAPGFNVSTYSSAEAPVPRRWVAVIERPGKSGPHMASFTFGPTEEVVRQKAADAIESWINPVKKGKQPADLDTVPNALHEDMEPI